MHSVRKITVTIAAVVIIVSLFSGCILEDLFGGDKTSFRLKSWDIIDDQGFPSISVVFTCNDRVTVKMINPEDTVVDSESFLASQRDEKNQGSFHLSSYGETVSPGDYLLKVYDKSNDKIYSGKFK